MVEYPIVVGGYQLYVHIVPKEISEYEYDKYYVGITGSDMWARWHGGAGYDGQIFGKAIRKYGANNIRHLVLFESISFIDANNLEKMMIRALHSHVKDKGYNVSLGGQGTSGPQPSAQKDITGMRFGRLVAKNRVGSQIKRERYRSLWHCECDCGNHCTVLLDNLMRYQKTNGQYGTGSCGCMSSRNFGTPNPNTYEFYDNYAIGHCNNGTTFVIDIDDYEKVQHRTWKVEKRFHHVVASPTYVYQAQRIESIILNIPTHNVDKLRLKYKNNNPADVRKSNLIIYWPTCDVPSDYEYFLRNVVANGIRFDHGNTWIVGRNNDSKHSVHSLEEALREYKERYGDDLLSDYLNNKKVRSDDNGHQYYQIDRYC